MVIRRLAHCLRAVHQNQIAFPRLRFHLFVAKQAVDRGVDEAVPGLWREGMGTPIAFARIGAPGPHWILNHGHPQIGEPAGNGPEIPDTELNFLENSVR